MRRADAMEPTGDPSKWTAQAALELLQNAGTPTILDRLRALDYPDLALR